MIQAKQKGVRLELLDKKALLANLANLYIEADIHKMGEVMRNLLSNAIKFTPRSGHVHVKVIVTDANPAIADSDKSAALSLSAVSLQSALLRAGRVQSRVDAGAEGQSKRANGTDKKMVLRIEVTDSGAGISPVSPLGLFSRACTWMPRLVRTDCQTWSVNEVFSATYLQENQKRLFDEIVQFSPGKLQSGGGSGLGLFSEFLRTVYYSWLLPLLT